MNVRIKELINLPEKVHGGDFVLKLTESVEHPDATLRSYVVTPELQTRVSHRVLRWFVRRGWLGADEARAMRDWHNDGGFSLDAAVRTAAWDRAGLERLLRYCARPRFAVCFTGYSRQSVGNYQGQLLADSRP